MAGHTVVDSGNRRKFETGSQRDMAEGKGRFDLLPFWSLWELSKHYEAGAKKYDANNWRKGQPLSVYFDSAMRHLAKIAMGYTDERHDLAALWNIACFIETKRRIELGQLPKELDDFPYVNMEPMKYYLTAINEKTGERGLVEFRSKKEIEDYLASLNKLHAAPGVPLKRESKLMCGQEHCTNPETSEDTGCVGCGGWSLEACAKPLGIDGKPYCDGGGCGKA